jgi:hypothetical protein
MASKSELLSNTQIRNLTSLTAKKQKQNKKNIPCSEEMEKFSSLW